MPWTRRHRHERVDTKTLKGFQKMQSGAQWLPLYRLTDIRENGPVKITTTTTTKKFPRLFVRWLHAYLFVITAVEFSLLKWCSRIVKFTMLWSSHMINHLVAVVAVLKSVWMLFKIGVTAQEPVWGGDEASSGAIVGKNSCDRKILGGCDVVSLKVLNGGGGGGADDDDDGNIVNGGCAINKVAFKANAEHVILVLIKKFHLLKLFYLKGAI